MKRLGKLVNQKADVGLVVPAGSTSASARELPESSIFVLLAEGWAKLIVAGRSVHFTVSGFAGEGNHLFLLQLH